MLPRPDPWKAHGCLLYILLGVLVFMAIPTVVYVLTESANWISELVK